MIPSPSLVIEALSKTLVFQIFKQSGYLGSSIKCEEAKDEDEGPETDQRDRVGDHLNFSLSDVTQ